MAARKRNNTYVFVLICVVAALAAMYFWPAGPNEPFADSGETYTAVIIEPRKHKAFEFVMRNFLENLDSRWNFIVFHGTENETYVKNILEEKFGEQSNRITTLSLGVPNLSLDEYSSYMMNKEFLHKIPTEVFLVFQTDSMICPQFKDKIYKFLEYDYVGAPWSWKHPPWKPATMYPKDEDLVGNGGLSLRRKTKMLEILEKCPILKPEPEDTYFALPCEAVQMHKPSSKFAKEFSMEGVYSENSFGVHKTWTPWHLGLSATEKIQAHCEGYKTLVELNT
jgi:hypothetical protein